MAVEYQLVPSGGMFSIEKNTGVITVTGTFDRETQAVYSLNVTAIDKGGLNTTEQGNTFALIISVIIKLAKICPTNDYTG